MAGSDGYIERTYVKRELLLFMFRLEVLNVNGNDSVIEETNIDKSEIFITQQHQVAIIRENIVRELQIREVFLQSQLYDFQQILATGFVADAIRIDSEVK